MLDSRTLSLYFDDTDPNDDDDDDGDNNDDNGDDGYNNDDDGDGDYGHEYFLRISILSNDFQEQAWTVCKDGWTRVQGPEACLPKITALWLK